MATLTFGQKSDLGRVRKMNQDSVAALTADELDRCADALFIVADGMGGRSGGEVASRVTVETIPQIVKQEMAQLNGAADAQGMAAVLREGITAANDAVWNQARSNPELRGMGTTCVGLLIKGSTAAICNVGDSRAYLLRGGELAQVTSDHSLVQEHVLSGELTEEEARASRYRNVITRGIGLTNTVTPDLDAFVLTEGDTLLLCSDGLTNMLTDREIGEIIAKEPDAQRACDQLVEAANANGGKDNITAIVIRYGRFTPTALARPNGHQQTPAPQPQIVYQRAHGSPWKAVVWTTIIYLLLAGIGAAYLYQNYGGWPELTARKRPETPKSKPEPQPKSPEPSKPNYDQPIQLTELQFQGQPLVSDGSMGVIGVDITGHTVHVTRGGTAKIGKLAPSTPTSPIESSWASDRAGNKYIAQRSKGTIVVLNPDDIQIATFSSDRLSHPDSIAVNAAGDIFVIDQHKLKLITRNRSPKKTGDVNPRDAFN